MVEFVRALVELYAPRAGEGQGLVEYGLTIVLIAVAVIALLAALGGQVSTIFTKITGSLQGSGF